MEKEEVLKLEYVKINDEYTVATIVYQNDYILKRNCFNDTELLIRSLRNPEFMYPYLFIRGSWCNVDKMPLIIPNKHLNFVKEKVKKLNKKYGVNKKWCPNINNKYYLISFDSENNISQGIWKNTSIENQMLYKNLIFKTIEEAEFVTNKILKNIDKWRKEYMRIEK